MQRNSEISGNFVKVSPFRGDIMSAVSYPEDVIRDLVDRKLPWTILKLMMSSPKDADRFDKYLKVLQEKVPWKEKIILPIHEHLFIVNKDGKPIVKALCGHEFGDYRENWKLKALIYVRNTEGSLKEIYPGFVTPNPDYVEIREFYCPKCGVLLDVEQAMPGHPIIFEFLPDLKTFYEKWLKRPLPCKETQVSFKDRSVELLKSWTEEMKKKETTR